MCGVSLLELSSLLFRALWFFIGIWYVVVLFVRCFLPRSWWLCFRHVFSGFVVTLVFRWLFFLWSAFLFFIGVWSHSFVFHSLLILCCLYLFLCSLSSLHFSSLVASLVVFHFAMFATPGLDSVFLRVCFVGLEYYFSSQTWALVSLWLASILPPLGYFSSSHASLGIGVWS